MLFRQSPDFHQIIVNCSDALFLREICDKYHYDPRELPVLRQVAARMQETMETEAAWQHAEDTISGGIRAVAKAAMTLGPGVDALQEEYSSGGFLTETYMTEVFGGEILRLAYGAYNRWVEENTPYHVARYFFPGSEPEYPIESLPELLRELNLPISCNDACYMIPKASVAFYALLTKEEGVRCEGLCVSCDRKDCPNSANKSRPLPYGYARIWGRNFR